MKQSFGQIDSRANSVKSLFDDKAGSWAAKYAPAGLLTHRLNQFADAVAATTSSRGTVFDLGCATGELARRISANGAQVLGCDISAHMLRIARAADRDQILPLVQLTEDWQILPMKTASFDAIVAASVLEYVQSPQTVLTECARVLKPGGVLICTVPDLRHPIRWLEYLAIPAARLLRHAPARVHDNRIGRYLTYLRVSRNRRPQRWWKSAAESAGLYVDSLPELTIARSPLLLLVFRRVERRHADATVPSLAHDKGAIS